MNKRDNTAVEMAYLRRITGYDVTEVKREYKVNEDGELELTRETANTKHVPGDARAAEFWLTNRKPRRWRYRRGEKAETPAEEGEAGVVLLPEVEEPTDALSEGEGEDG